MITDIFSMGELFEEVQMQHVFPDGKTFVDCTPVTALTEIQKKYNHEKTLRSFDLKSFVSDNFKLPKASSAHYSSDAARPVVQHIEMLWNVLTRQPSPSNDSLIALPYPYIVPGGRFREIYYWDSYFTMLGLRVSGKLQMIRYMTDNFSYLIDHVGYIPNGNRTYYKGRSQPPFYACIVRLLAEEKGPDILVEYLPWLEKEYAFWMKGSERLSSQSPAIDRVVALPDGAVLNRYWDASDTPRSESFKEDVELARDSANKNVLYRHLRAAAESGWDFSSRWFRDGRSFSSIHTTEIIPVDLNCLLWHLEQTLAEGYRLSGNDAFSETYTKAAAARQKAIDKYCWSDERRFYFDYDFVENKQKTSLTLAAAYPLFFKIASGHQSQAVADKLAEHFLFPGGLITTTEATGQQWDAPNGWAPLQWIAVKGLAAYGHMDLANDITKRWLQLNEKVYKNTGKMMEKYNVVDTALDAGGGEYPAQDGFGWTNGVYLAMGVAFGV